MATKNRPKLHSCSSRRRGSALILSMTMALILLGSVAAMLYASRMTVRQTSDRYAYEECYDCAMSGLSAAKFWLFKHGSVAKSQIGANLGNKIDAISSGCVDLANYVRENDSAPTLINSTGMPGSKILGYFTKYDGSFGTQPTPGLVGDRKIICDLGSSSSQLILLRRDVPQLDAQNLFTGTDKVRSYISNIRFTTPYRNDNVAGIAADDLRRVIVIVEATAVTLTAGVKKTRTLQQKLLIVPTNGDNTNPILGPVAGVAFGGGAVTVQGASSLNVRWGPVWSKGDIQLLQLSFGAGKKTGDPWLLNGGGSGNTKFFGAGVLADGNTDLEKWAKYQTAGILTTTGQVPIFGTLGTNADGTPYSTLNGTKVTDFFVQSINSNFGTSYTPNRIQLGGSYAWTTSGGQWFASNTGAGILYGLLAAGQTTYTTGTGALVQSDIRMVEKINNLINSQLDYTTWKNFAIANSSYVRPNAGGNEFYNANGQILYVTGTKTLTTSAAGNTKLTSLDQLSMASLIPSDGNTISLRDRILFVDTVSGTQNGTFSTVGIGSSFFWKGLLYVQGNISTTGISAGQSILMKNPDEYTLDPKGTTTGARHGSCYLDGVMLVAGTLNRNGNGCIYGSLIAKGGYNGGGSPDIYYNSRNSGGLFKEVVDNQTIAQIITGPTKEV